MEEGPVFEAVVERPDGGPAVVRARGELDLLSTPALREALEQARADGADLTLDLSGLEFVDSTGVHLVLDAYMASRRDGWELAIVGARAEVLRAFELVGLSDRLPFRGPGRSSS